MTSYRIDAAHSEITFSVRHMMFSRVRGTFQQWSATLAYDPANPTRAALRVEVDAATVDTLDAQRDAQLRDLLDVRRFPVIVFESKRVEPSGGGRYSLSGDLTIRDVTHEATLAVEASAGTTHPASHTRLAFRAKGAIDRRLWGLKWQPALEAGGVLVSDRVDVEVDVQVLQTA